MKNMLLFVLAIATVLATSSVQAVVVLPPEGVDEYRIIFTTISDFQAASTDIEWYNAQVTDQMQLSGQLYGLSIEHNLDWYCIGSTETVDARDNISPGITWDAENIPIYNTHGELVANNLVDLFDGSIAENADFDQWGDNVSGYNPHPEVWTGTDEWGCSNTNALWGGSLGSTNRVTIGRSFMRDEAWLKWVWDDPQNQNLLYSISSPIPESATLGLISLFTGGLWFARRFFTV